MKDRAIKALERLSRIKAKLTTIGFYISMFNTVVLVSIKGWQWWYVIAAVAVIFIYWFESYFGIKGANTVANTRSEHAIDVTARLERIEQRLKGETQ